MKHHECPSCGERYQCSRGDCGSPLVYDCFFCYVACYAKQLEAASSAVASRFGLGGDGPPVFECYAD